MTTGKRQAGNLGQIVRVLSQARWEAYRQSGEPHEAVAGRYAWNVAMCQALYPALHVLEISLRNRVFAAGQTQFRIGAHNGVPCWLDADPPILNSGSMEEVGQAKAKLIRNLKHKYAAGWRTRLTPGRLVAELSFGFWTYLFRSEYAAEPVRPGILWPQLLGAVFPHLPSGIQRSDIEKRLSAIRLLRNRVFHHEPIWNDPRLAQTYAEIIDMCAWLSAPLHMNLLAFDRFPAVSRPAVERYLRRRATEVNRK